MFLCSLVLGSIVIRQAYANPIVGPPTNLDAGRSDRNIAARDHEPDLSTLTRLYGYLGCNKDDEKAVNRAFADAIEIAAAVAPSVNDVDKIDPNLRHNVVW
ncbi:uncharacterized protein LTR77_008656 [Saxophila tyrrhenica]|uniref:Uncharacterized protein n=1 Tax=Saxophila tyrrhenica TaxID=1690608 RepID=A0AAV9P2Q9_9PEZI|nr:hypothetical protein LTR77_008656 [Saxophila tyrrhenica]